MRIIHADDEFLIREDVAEFLTLKGHKVESVSDGSELLERLDPAMHDVVVTDGHMHTLGGLAVLQHIKSTPALLHIPVLVVSGDDGISDRVVKMGGHFVSKMHWITALPILLDEIAERSAR